MDLNEYDLGGRTAFHCLLESRYQNDKDALLDAVTKLVQLGANPRIHTEEGWSGLHILMNRLNHHNKDAILAVATKLVVEFGIDPSRGPGWHHSLALACQEKNQ